MSASREFLDKYYVPDDEFVICRKVMTRAREQNLSFLENISEHPAAHGSNLYVGRVAINLIGYDEISLMRQFDERLTARLVISALKGMREHDEFTYDDFLYDVSLGDVNVYTDLDGDQYIGAEIEDNGVTFAEREYLKKRFYDLGGSKANLETKQPVICLAEIDEDGEPSDELLDHIQNQVSGATLDFFEVMVREA